MSVESQMRYADFLIYAHDPADYQILQTVATIFQNQLTLKYQFKSIPLFRLRSL